MKVLIFGATGLTGTYLTEICLADAEVEEVVVFVRKSIGIVNSKLTEKLINYEQLTDYQEYIKGDVVFNCLGTTLAKMGSKEAQQVIDRDYPIQIAQLAASNQVPLMINVSSVGADSNASNFYLKTKGAMENGVQNAIGEGAYFFRPSMLLGERKEFRLGERIGIFAMNFFDLFLRGGLSHYHSINAKNVAQAMLNLAKTGKNNSKVFHYKEIMNLLKK